MQEIQDRNSTRTLENNDPIEPVATRAQKREAKRMVKLFNKIQNKEKVKADLYLKYDSENERWIKDE